MITCDEAWTEAEAGAMEGPVSAYLARVDGSDGAIGHGREGFSKMTRVPMVERRKIAAGMRRAADLLDPPKETS